MHDSVAHSAYVAYFGRDDALARAAEADTVYAAGRAAVADCEATPPGPELLAKILAAREMAMDTASRITLYGCWERQMSWTAAEQMTMLSEAAGGTPQGESDAWVVSDVALSTGLSEHTIGSRFAMMRRTGAAMPVAWTALHAGQLTTAHHWVLDQVLREADPEVAGKVEAIVVPKAIASGWTPAQLRNAATFVLLQTDPQGCEERAARARRTRTDVSYRAQEEMLASLVATGDPATLKAIMEEVEQHAQALRRAGDPRGTGELRLAAMAALIFGTALTPETTHDPELEAADQPEAANEPAAAAGEELGDDQEPTDEPTASGSQRPQRRTGVPQTLVVMSLSSLLGGTEPAELVGHGPITAAMARRIARDSVLRRLVCDPLTGRPVDLGRTSYRPSKQMRDWLAVRDRTCLFPGCRRPPWSCQVDHEQEWDAGGETSCDNCGLLCQRHHNYKTRKAWDLTRGSDDMSRWDSPHGFVWCRAAATYEDHLGDPDPDRDDERLLDLEVLEFDTLDVDPYPDEIPLPDPPPPVDDDEIAYDQWNRAFSSRSLAG